MGSKPSRPKTYQDIQVFFEKELGKPTSHLDFHMPICMTGRGPVPVGDDAILHRRLRELMLPRGIYIDSCTVRGADYAALRDAAYADAKLGWNEERYTPPYDWIATITIRKSKVLPA